MILVTFAVPQESRDFRRALAEWKGEEIRVAHVGMGESSAAKEMARLLAREKPRLLICAGFGGGLDERLQIADVLIAENYSDPEWLAQARNLPGSDLSYFFGPLVSQATTAETPAAKAALARQSGAMAVDMETATVSAACQAADVPVLAIRSISDTLSMEIPLPLEVCYDLKKQRPKALGVVTYLLTHPARIRPFIHFLRGLSPASRALADFLFQFLATTASSPPPPAKDF